ncbi:ferredoxin family protein [Chloroflexota bacterium]
MRKALLSRTIGMKDLKVKAVHQVYVDGEYCKGVDECGICVWICPKHVFDVSARLNTRGIRPPEVVRIEDCTGCENCMVCCPDLAIVVAKEAEARVTS